MIKNKQIGKQLAKEAIDAIIAAINEEMCVAELEPLGVTVKTITGLEREFGIIYVEDLLGYTPRELKAGLNLGILAFKQVEFALNNLHLLTEELKRKFTLQVIPNFDIASKFRLYK